jgi:glycosyltransferase involved in cell wall biosynthesis
MGHLDTPVDHVAASDLFVLLSSQEGISNALLEAMDAGVPAYATLVGGHGEFIDDGVNAWPAHSRARRGKCRQTWNADHDQSHSRQAVAQPAAGIAVQAKLFSMQAMGDRLEAVISGAIAEARNATNPDA